MELELFYLLNIVCMKILCSASAFQQFVDQSWICSLRSRMWNGYWATQYWRIPELLRGSPWESLTTSLNSLVSKRAEGLKIFEHKHFCYSQFSQPLTVLVATLWWCKAADCRVEMCCRGLVWHLWHCGHHKKTVDYHRSTSTYQMCHFGTEPSISSVIGLVAISAFLQLIWQNWTTEMLK